MPAALQLDEFNSADAADAASLAALWAAIPWWTEALVAARPYSSLAALEEHARALARRWSAADLDAALAHHPRIGERPAAAGAEADASRREQAAMHGAAADVASQIAELNRAYEDRFGRVFLIRAAGRSPEEMLAQLRRRLGNDAGTEAREALGQLTEIAILRLRTAVAEPPAGSPIAPASGSGTSPGRMGP